MAPRGMTPALCAIALVAESAVPRNAARQTAPEAHLVVRAGEATVDLRIRGQGDPLVFIPSRGRGVEDFADLSSRLVRAGYQAILPQPRGIAGSTGPLDGISYQDLAADIAATIREVVGGPAVVVGHAFGSRLARTLAADHLQLVSRLILIAPPGPVARSEEVRRATDRMEARHRC